MNALSCPEEFACARRLRRWMVRGYCRLTGPWCQIVLASSAADAVARYASEHGMSPEDCTAAPA